MVKIDKERFGLNQGRKRPPYMPRTVHCPNCSDALSIKDEHSEFVVCKTCSSHLKVSEAELIVLGKGPDKERPFPLKIGDSFLLKGVRYEIIGRMAFKEQDDPSEISNQYLLFNPRRGTLWLDEYRGSYVLSSVSHLMPTSDPFTKTMGSTLMTYDGREWVSEEQAEYKLVYVDGALPWVAEIGDRVKSAEFSEKGGSGLRYEVETAGQEVEYALGQPLTLQQVRAATGKADLHKGRETKAPMDAARKRKAFLGIMWIALTFTILNGIIGTHCLFRGKKVLEQIFQPAQLREGDALSIPFNVSSNGSVLRIDAEASVDNAWMALDLGIVRDDEMVLHVTGCDMSYYHGVEGGESWSEGSRSESIYLKIPKAGKYRLLVHAVSGTGETETSARHDLMIKVFEGVLLPHFFIAAAIFSLVVFCISAFAYMKWRGLIKEDED